MKKIISVVVPVYNVQLYIGDCIKSILNQSYNNIELLLIDDGSIDKSGVICDEFAKKDGRIKVIHKPNGGVSSARNEGIKAATGDYIMFVDGDDLLENEALEKMFSKIESTGADACFCDRYIKNSKIVQLSIPCNGEKLISSNTAVKRHLRFEFIASPCFGLISLPKVKNCLFDQEIHAFEDWEYNFRMLTCIDSLTICQQAFYNYRTVEGSASKSSLDDRKMTCFLITEKVKKYIQDNNLPYDKQAENIPAFLLYHMLVVLANESYVVNQSKQLCRIARGLLKSSLKSDNISKKLKFYTLLAAVSPRLFCLAYHIKYRGRNNG